jgi:PEP-CTERM motif-containing protein
MKALTAVLAGLRLWPLPLGEPVGLLAGIALTFALAAPAGAGSPPPIPIPGGLLVPNPFGGPDVHFHAPGPVDSATPNTVGGDPSTIYNFNGFVGVAHVEGTGTDNSGRNLFWDTDLRFMEGAFLLADGNIAQDAFAFVSLGVYTSQSKTVQIHEFNPGFGLEVSPVGGNGFGTRTFWTTAIPPNDLTVQFAAGEAEMKVQNLVLDDFGTIPNALGHNWQTNFDPAVVSFDVVWSGPATRGVTFTDSTDGDQFTGSFVENQVTVTWSGTNQTTGFSFTANPGTFATSAVDGGFALLGLEQNGATVPEPPSLCLLAGGLLGFVLIWRRKVH